MMILPYPHHAKRVSPHRQKNQIVNEILTCIANYPNGTCNKTRLIYSVQISSEQLRKYISWLTANGLITIRPATDLELKRNQYIHQYLSITQKGLIFLKLYDAMHKDFLLYGLSTSREIREGTRLQDYEGEEGGQS